MMSMVKHLNRQGGEEGNTLTLKENLKVGYLFKFFFCSQKILNLCFIKNFEVYHNFYLLADLLKYKIEILLSLIILPNVLCNPAVLHFSLYLLFLTFFSTRCLHFPFHFNFIYSTESDYPASAWDSFQYNVHAMRLRHVA